MTLALASIANLLLLALPPAVAASGPRSGSHLGGTPFGSAMDAWVKPAASDALIWGCPPCPGAGGVLGSHLILGNP